MEKNKNYFYRLRKEKDKFECIPFDPNDQDKYTYSYYIKWVDHNHETTENGELMMDSFVSDIMTDSQWSNFKRAGYLIDCSAYITTMEYTKESKTNKYKFFQMDGKDPNNQNFSMALFFPSELDIYWFANYFMQALDMLEKYKDPQKVSDVFKTLYGPIEE